MNPPRFFIYGLIDPRTGEVRYIGKSATGMKRPNLHRKPSCLRKDRSHKAHWIRQLQALGLVYKIEILDIVQTREELNAAECYWIAEARAHGWKLTNHTDGGDGLSGHTFTEEHRRKISLANKGRRLTDEQRQKLSEAAKRRPGRKERAAVATAAWRGRKHSAATKKRIGAAHRGKYVSAATRAKIAAGRGKAVREMASGTIYVSAAAAAKALGLEYSGVRKVASGRRRLRSIHGFKFEYLQS